MCRRWKMIPNFADAAGAAAAIGESLFLRGFLFMSSSESAKAAMLVRQVKVSGMTIARA
jgi:hypothetical protein